MRLTRWKPWPGGWGALDRFIRLRPGQPVINLLDYLTKRFNTSVTTQFLERLCEISQNAAGSANQGELYWQAHTTRCMHACIDLALIAQGTASIVDVDLIASSVPASPEEVTEDFYNHTACGVVIRAAEKFQRPDEKHRFQRAADYLRYTLPSLGDRAIGAITSQIQNVVGNLCVEPFRDSLSGETVITPDLIEEQQLIVALDFPVQINGLSGRLFQAAFTMLTQLHCLKRSVEGLSRPCVIVRDECGLLLHGEWDLQCQLTSRSQMCAHIDAAQDYNMLFRSLGGSTKSEHEALSFASNHRTTLAFGNSNVRTNEHYSKLFGHSLQITTSGGGWGGRQQMTGNFADDLLGVGGGAQWSQQQLPVLRSDVFTQLPTGMCVLIEGGRFRTLDLRRRL